MIKPNENNFLQHLNSRFVIYQAYVNPLNKAMPHQEARQLIGFGDDNEDGVLSLEELLDNSEYFTGSKLYNYAKNIHDDL